MSIILLSAHTLTDNLLRPRNNLLESSTILLKEWGMTNQMKKRSTLVRAGGLVLNNNIFVVGKSVIKPHTPMPNTNILRHRNNVLRSSGPISGQGNINQMK